MVHTPKAEWFLAARDIPPDSTITLGKLITTPKNPVGPPYLHAVDIDSPIRELNYAWIKHESTSKGGKAGVFGTFLAEVVGVGADVSGNVQWGTSADLDVDTLQVLTFEPSKAYLTRLLNEPRNVEELGQGKTLSRFQKLFVITGIQVARSGSVKTGSSRDWAGEVAVSVNPALPAGVPGIEVGPKVGMNQKVERTESSGKHDFVYAFKINKILYKKEKGLVSQERHTRGAAFSDERGRYGQDEEDIVVENPLDRNLGFEVLGMQKEEAGRNEFGVEGNEVLDQDGESCVVINTKTMEDSESEEEDEDDD